jgi:hypothetical protein
MIIKIKQTVQTEKEININFPFITYDVLDNKYYYNYDYLHCIQVNKSTNTIFHSRFSNEGLEFTEIRKEDFFKAFDENLQELLTILNK